MYLKTKLEKLENKAGIRKRKRPLMVVQVQGESNEATMRRNGISPKIKATDEKLIFIVTNIQRRPNDPPLKEN
jgi:hypothetical protein